MNALILFVCVWSCAIATVDERLATPMEHPDEKCYIIYTDENGHIKEYLLTDTDESKVTAKDITFYFYTLKNPDNPSIIPAEHFEVYNTHFNRERKNVFIAHGMNNNFSSPVNKIIKKAIFQRGYDVNLFVIDWHKPAAGLTSPSTVLKTGRIVGNIIKKLMEKYSIKPSAFRLIGHSLGAHLLGNAGQVNKGSLSSLVALDSAMYMKRCGQKIEYRLNSTVADHVQIIHTSYFGNWHSYGTADYYVNWGLAGPQPGCYFIDCSHSRAYEFYGESIETGGFSARRCNNPTDYDNGLCDSNHKSFMGQLDIDKRAHGDYYLNTTLTGPPWSND